MNVQVPSLDRRAVLVIAWLAFLAVAVNVDRFVLRTGGPLRAHDLADNTVTRLAGCGELWRSSLASAWDAGRVRGWPVVSGDYAPEHAMCVVAGVVRPHLILPILHVLLLAVMAVGTFLFVQYFINRREDVAVAGAVLQVVLYFFFHEHPMVTSATLLPALVGYLSVPAGGVVSRAIQVGGSVLVMALSNPTSTLFAMPVGHLALIFLAPPRSRAVHLARFTVFWLAYGVYYAPTLLSQVGDFAGSSRSLYRSNPQAVSYTANLKGMLLNPAVISPAVVFIALVNRRTLLGTVLFFLLVAGGVALAAANQLLVGSDLAARFPILLMVSTMYYRMYYFVPVAVLVWVTWLWQDDERLRGLVLLRRALVVAAFCLLIARPLGDTNWPGARVFEPYWRYALVLGLSMAFGLNWWTRRAWTTVMVAAAVIVFARYEYTKTWEVPLQGNLFLEEPRLGQPKALGRSVTVMSGCDAVDLFPAQARVAGMDTLDGISNLYDRGFVERWRYFVADNPALCTSRYAVWPTRAELTVRDLEYASDRILPWLWINNVEFVRAPVALDYPELQLVEHRPFTYGRLQRATRYLYRMRNPVGRVFTVPDAIARRAASPDLAIEEATLSDLVTHGGLSNVDAEAVDGAHLRFSGAFDPGRTVVANVNYHRHWRLRIDDRASKVPLEPGPFGMIAFQPPGGHHTYELEFVSPVTPFVPIGMLVSIGVLWVMFGPGVRARLASVRPRQKVPIWLTAGAIIASIGLIAGALSWMGADRSTAAWLAGPWPHRIPLQTAGAFQTAPLSNFPLRIESTSADAHFWSGVQPSGGDIRFADASGQLLPLEIEEFDPGRQRLVAWVRVPQLATGPQTLGYLYYGNAQAELAPNAEPVWDAHYEAVWHLNPRQLARDGFLSDSSGHGHAGMRRGAQASIDDPEPGISFDGRGAAIEVANWPGLRSPLGDWTVEFLIRPAPLNKRNFGLLRHGDAGAFHLYLHNGGFLVLERRNDTGASETSLSKEQIPQSEWTSVALTRTRQHLRLALNGVTASAYRVTPEFTDGAMPPAPLTLGVGPHGPLEGRLAEVRVSKGIARSADWTLATARSQAPSFVTLGRRETR
jgi:hypothetical protein